MRLCSTTILALAVALSAPAVIARGKPTAFDAAALASPEQLAAAAPRYWKPQGLKAIRAAGLKKAAIVEFSVEYVTVEKTDANGNGCGLLDIAQAAGVGKKHTEIDQSVKESLPRDLHDAFSKQLTDAGFEVSSLESVSTNPAFAKLRGDDEPGTKRTVKGGGYRATKSTKMEVYPWTASSSSRTARSRRSTTRRRKRSSRTSSAWTRCSACTCASASPRAGGRRWRRAHSSQWARDRRRSAKAGCST